MSGCTSACCVNYIACGFLALECACMRVYGCVYVCLCVCVFVRMSVCVYIVHVWACLCVYAYVCTFVCSIECVSCNAQLHRLLGAGNLIISPPCLVPVADWYVDWSAHTFPHCAYACTPPQPLVCTACALWVVSSAWPVPHAHTRVHVWGARTHRHVYVSLHAIYIYTFTKCTCVCTVVPVPK